MAILGFYPDRKIINRICANDRSVLGELFQQYEKMVGNYVAANGGDRNDAEDILQETIIVLWQNVCAGGFELTAKLSTYLMGIAKNKWMAEMRKRKRRAAQEIPQDISDGRLSALDRVIADERTKCVQQALAKLGDVCRELLLLFYFEERNFNDIAGIMGFRGPGVAKSKKYQCKKQLEIILKKITTEAEGKL